MERYNAASHSERTICKPSSVALWYREQAAPLPPSESVVSLPQSAILYEHQPSQYGETPDQHDLSPQTADALKAVKHAPMNDTLTKLRTPYDDYERYLTYWLKRLKHPVAVEEPTPDSLPAVPEPPEPCTYTTTLGTVSFAELVVRTRKYAASVLRNTYQVNEADIDDGLQAGYMQLWQRLRAEPALLEDKSLAWIGKGIIYTALHATRGDWQFRRHTQTNGEVANPSAGNFAAHSRESRKTDIQTDLYQAVGCVEQEIRVEEKGKRQDYALWALFGLTIFQLSASETSRLVGVREQSVQAAYKEVKERLQKALPNYAPVGATKPFRQRGRRALPQQDMTVLRKSNGTVPPEIYEAVYRLIEAMNADTRPQDEIALEGIRRGIPAATQSRTHGWSQPQMHRAYDRVHLMIGAHCDPTVRMRRPEHRVKAVFTLTEESRAAVEQLALELLKQPKCYEKLVALHAHISNLAISTTAKHFNIPTSTLRYYAQRIGVQLQTPTQPAREAEVFV